MRLPARLLKDPILEVAFELRFVPIGPAAADKLLGSIYAPFRERFPDIVRLSDLPERVHALPPLKYRPRLQLKGEHFSIYLGDHSINISNAKPYQGWTNFRPLILEVLDQLDRSGVVKIVERMSVKYVNWIPGESPAEQFSHLNLTANLGPYNLAVAQTHLRSEIVIEALTNIIEVTANAVAQSANAERIRGGLILTVDSIAKAPTSFWQRREELIDKVHRVAKGLFFQILTPETIESLEPEWE